MQCFNNFHAFSTFGPVAVTLKDSRIRFRHCNPYIQLFNLFYSLQRVAFNSRKGHYNRKFTKSG